MKAFLKKHKPLLFWYSQFLFVIIFYLAYLFSSPSHNNILSFSLLILGSFFLICVTFMTIYISIKWFRYEERTSIAFLNLKNHFEPHGFKEIVISEKRGLIGVVDGIITSLDFYYEELRVTIYRYFPEEKDHFFEGYFPYAKLISNSSMTPYEEILTTSIKKLKKEFTKLEEPKDSILVWTSHPSKELEELASILPNYQKRRGIFKRELIESMRPASSRNRHKSTELYI